MRHGLTPFGALTVIRDSRGGFPSRGRGCATHHGDALPAELQRPACLPATYSGTEQVLIGVRKASSWLRLAILCDLEEDLVFTMKLAWSSIEVLWLIREENRSSPAQIRCLWEDLFSARRLGMESTSSEGWEYCDVCECVDKFRLCHSTTLTAAYQERDSQRRSAWRRSVGRAGMHLSSEYRGGQGAVSASQCLRPG